MKHVTHFINRKQIENKIHTSILIQQDYFHNLEANSELTE